MGTVGILYLLTHNLQFFKKLDEMSDEARFLVSGWEDDLESIDEETKPHETPEKEVLWAAEGGHLEKLKELIESDAALVHVKDKDGYTPLHRACSGNHVALVDYLLDKGSDVSSTSDLLWQPLHSCCHWNHREIALKLIQRGADVNAASEGKQTPLHIAASHGASYDIVQLLLLHPHIKPGLVNNTNETAYDLAKRSSKYYKIFEMADPLIQGIPD